MLKGMTALLAFALVSACASHSKAIPAKPVVRRIAIIPASDPVWYTLENAAPPIGYPMQFWVNKLDSKHKAKVFNDRLHSPPITLGSDFTEQARFAVTNSLSRFCKVWFVLPVILTMWMKTESPATQMHCCI
jgi:hypothetical protein